MDVDFSIFQLKFSCNFGQAQAITPELCKIIASPIRTVLPLITPIVHAHSMKETRLLSDSELNLLNLQEKKILQEKKVGTAIHYQLSLIL